MYIHIDRHMSNLLTKIIPAWSRWLRLSGRFPIHMRIPPLEH